MTNALSPRWLITWLIGVAAPAAVCADPPAEPPRTPAADTQRIDELIDHLRGDDYRRRDDALYELVDIGPPTLPALMKVALYQPGQGNFAALSAFRLMGEKARPALAELIDIARTEEPPDPPNVPLNYAPRFTALRILGLMDWAADQTIPLFAKIAEDKDEAMRFRKFAVLALSRSNGDALPILRRLAQTHEEAMREQCRGALANLQDKLGIQPRREYYTELVEKDWFDPRVPIYLVSVAQRDSDTGPDPLTAKVKAAYRKRLDEQPDPQIAFNLARIIQRELAGNNCQWSAPADGGSSPWAREDPDENHDTMADALTVGLDHADDDSILQEKLGIALAKLRLLQGRWNDMNEVLNRIGFKPIPAKDRPFLLAPPAQWDEDLAAEWSVCDEKMRSGDCRLVFTFEKDGKPLAGVHALVKERDPEPQRVFRTGIKTDTLFFSPMPIAWYASDETFGYGGSDRAATRYGVSDQTGTVTFEKLPEVPVKIEVLVPTANFTESGRRWDLWMEVEPGRRKRAVIYGGPDAVNFREPPAVVELQAGKTVHYPKLIVLPELTLKDGTGLDLKDWAKVDPENFVLAWSAPPAHRPIDDVTYDLTMSLTGPGEQPRRPVHMTVIQSSTQTLRDTRHPVGAEGVGGHRLQPGNMYLFRLLARDRNGTVVARSATQPVWVPWTHRPCDPPYIGGDPYRRSPIRVRTWHNGTAGVHGGPRETLQQRIERHLRDYPHAFEREYLLLGKAWLDWRDGNTAGARTQVQHLMEDLPPTNVPHATAASLLDALQAGSTPPKSLILLAPDEWKE